MIFFFFFYGVEAVLALESSVPWYDGLFTGERR